MTNPETKTDLTELLYKVMDRGRYVPKKKSLRALEQSIRRGEELLKNNYIYLGDRMTDVRFKRQECKAVRNINGKCIRGKNSNMLVRFSNGEVVVILARLLRKIK